MHITRDRLADGREIIYYDAAPLASPPPADSRPLPARAEGAELRYDPLGATWVMYSSSRQDRTYMPAADECPLCPSSPGRASGIPRGTYEVVVFENRFSALTGTGPVPAPEPCDLMVQRPSSGRCEVVCYTSDHSSSFADLDLERVGLVVDALAQRTQELGAVPGVEQVFCFENRGTEIGVTQPHPHGQIYAYPFVTPKTTQALACASAYGERCGTNLWDDLVAAERAAGSRVVLASEHWTAFVPHAARWPFELHCYPNERVPDLASLGADARAELPQVLSDIFGRFTRLFDAPAPYIAAWHQAPVHYGRDLFALHLELFTVRRTNDKLKYLAGSESGMGAFANDVLPEDAAARLRQAGSGDGTLGSARPWRDDHDGQ